MELNEFMSDDDIVLNENTNLNNFEEDDIPEAAVDADGIISKEAKREDKLLRKMAQENEESSQPVEVRGSLKFEDDYVPPVPMKPFSSYKDDFLQLRKDILYRIYAGKYYFDGYEPNDPILISKGKRPDREPRYNYFTAEFLGAGVADGQLALIEALKKPVEYYVSDASKLTHKIRGAVDALFIKCYSELFDCNLFVKIYQFSDEYFIVELHEFKEREEEE